MNHEFTGVVERFHENPLWSYHIHIPEEIANSIIQSETGRRVVCTLNGDHSIHCALMPDGKGQWFINLHQQIRKKSRIELGDPVVVHLEPDTSEYGMPIPEELEELLYQDPEGSEIFHSFTKGKQRSLIYWVSQVKSSQIRLRRALVLIDHLKIHGDIDYKALQSEIREANQNAKYN
ncbi:MAG: YdeI/OmpD-associated family protein [Bacteroidota bacterium]|nr:YdeI/OmpD-associated family protein [Bacteroidota bacterium]